MSPRKSAKPLKAKSKTASKVSSKKPVKARAAAAGVTLSQEAYQRIKTQILSAHYEPGQFLQESLICKEIGIGRTPVHQALHQLMQEGLLEVIPRKGILIKSDSLTEILAALEVRLLLEPHCAAMAAQRMSHVDHAKLKLLLDKTLELAGKGSKAALMELDREFHTILTSSAGNPIIADFLAPIHERMTRIWFQPHWLPHDFDMTGHEHEAVYKALIRRDADGASNSMRVHIQSLRDRLLKSND